MTRPCRSPPATRCGSRRASGTPLPTPATATARWSSASRTRITRRPSGGSELVAVGQDVREQVATACRLLAAEGYADLTLGHVSARDGDGSLWIKRRGVALDEVEPDDVIPLEVGAGEMHLEAVLHSEVYKLRSDVGAVVHGHPPYA